MLDLAGPLQTFQEANTCGGRYTITIAASSPQLDVVQPLTLTRLASLPMTLQGDLIIVPGYDLRQSTPPAS